jgi:hypothetical protein
MVPTSFVVPFRLCCVAGCACAGVFGFADQLQGVNQPGDELVQLALVVFGECSQDAVAYCGDVQGDTTAIGGVLPAKDQPCFFTSLAEFDDAVMAKAQSFGDVGDGGFNAVGRSGYVQKELMLLGMETGFGRAALAEMKELSQGIAKLGQGLQPLLIVSVRRNVHKYIISYYDIYE